MTVLDGPVIEAALRPTWPGVEVKHVRPFTGGQWAAGDARADLHPWRLVAPGATAAVRRATGVRARA